ncbi:MAG: hypothetical protein EBU61_06030 [Crocinitomicaceae bacterium]|nr:hypothetical protein [Crocinitomicaceae bacterium]
MTSKEKGKYLVAYLKNQQEMRTQTELITGGAIAAYLQMDPNFFSLVSISSQTISEWKKYKKSTKKILLSQAYYRYLEAQKNLGKNLKLPKRSKKDI